VLKGLSKRAVIRTGYGVVIAVLILSAVEAYRIQVSVSEQQVEIYRRYVDEDSTIATLRRNLWLAGNDIRDFFIETTPAQANTLRSQIDALKKEDEQVLQHLARISSRRDIVPQLRKSLDEFWAIVDPLPDTMLNQSGERHFDFLQREIVPRRGELYTALMGLTAADQQRLQENEQEFAATRRHAAQRLLGMLALSVFLCILVARFSVRHAENMEHQAEKHFAEVEQTKRELQQLSARLLEIEEEGRRKLSRELHDEIGQTLALLQIEISNAQSLSGSQPDVVRERLRRAHELAGRTVQTIRNISVLLRPALLDDLGLVPALQYQLEEFSRRSGIACEFVEEHVAERLADPVKTCVYRVVQEALHNCEKHSGASKVRVAVRQLPDCLLAEVEDNGCGFEVNQIGMPNRAKGLGLLGIRERVAIAGGSLVVDTAPGHGTRIALRIPLASSQQPEQIKEINA
jgi:signal transduction histidine kinase